MASWKPTHGDRKPGGGGVFHTSCMETWELTVRVKISSNFTRTLMGPSKNPGTEQPTKYEVDKRLKERV
ncbi:uncharacterized protein N7503_011105 [Penicillium pulvis]|uniref:uncharacterized protein n=1 Tax=Penicillium pulvis TaxID=1562058 RepID=UPI0025478BCC|nr:uncharacterized protein N7503_011105 [Penicillium pulvis]KAJ5785893.1 hypothetical protein N7503_011105 [Penicillium pulvis]